ncbi:MAG TPA: class I SAM-dependent methyltransferase [Actinomycetota bacterium]|nr:class I SAM-dependent methyltransferase [Actinomycetota bacterium]
MPARRVSATSESVSFDPAVEYYDKTRSLPANVHSQVIDLLFAELRDRGPVLEVGVGTGRVALDLHRRGIEIAGVDLSPAMLGVLVQKAEGIPFPLAVGDAVTLPFADGIFETAYGAHILQLISNWAGALTEMARVVRPGGTVLIDMANWVNRDAGRTIYERLCHELGVENLHRGVIDVEPVDELMASLGTKKRTLPEVEHSVTRTIRHLIDRLESNQSATTWHLSDAERTTGCAAVRKWAENEYGDIDKPIEIIRNVRMFAYDLLRSP